MKKLVLDKNTIKTLKVNTNIKTGNTSNSLANTGNCQASGGGLQSQSMILSGSKPPRSIGGSGSVNTIGDPANPGGAC